MTPKRYNILFIKGPHSSLPPLEGVNARLGGAIHLHEVETAQLDSEVESALSATQRRATLLTSNERDTSVEEDKQTSTDASSATRESVAHTSKEDNERTEEAIYQNSPGWKLLQEADFLLLFSHGSISFFRQFERFWERFSSTKPIFFHSTMEDEVAEMADKFTLSEAHYRTIYRYMAARNEENLYRLAHFLAHTFGGLSVEVQEPAMPTWEGYYKPFHPKDIEVGERVIGVLFHQRQVALDDLQHINALVHAIEESGAVCVPVYCTLSADQETGERGVFETIRHFFYHDGRLLPDVIINLLGYSLGIFDGEGALFPTETAHEEPLKQLGIPVIQAYATYFNYEQWKASIQGLDAFSLVSSVYYPEFDGQIDGYPIGCLTYHEEQRRYLVEPLAEGIEVVTRLALNWAHLRHKRNEEKRVAILFHNMPPRNDAIGCAAGLDSPATVLNLVNRLRESGIRFQNSYQNGDEIISKIIAGLSNDTSWLSTEEVLERAPAMMTTEQYKQLYETLEQETQRAIEKHWGEAPGTFKVIGEQIPIPGILDDHLYIGLQPPRGYEEHADEAYHSTDIACPHYYIAFYKWLKYDFGADVVVHIGTHGTLEWLPGKEKGLSRACLPQVCIDDLPHLYIYHTTVIGEGIQAKRRSAAVLLNHLEPVSVESGTYGELGEMDQQIQKYLSAPLSERHKTELADEILSQAEALHLLTDLGFHSREGLDPSEVIPELHGWIGVIKQSQVKDGLHIFGEAPEGDRLLNFLRVLVRVSNGNTPPLMKALATYYGVPYEQLKREPNHVWEGGRTSTMLIDEWTERGKELVKALAKNEYKSLTDKEITTILGSLQGEVAPIRDVLTFIAEEAYPRVRRTYRELDEFSDGMAGRFVRSAKGGSPSRGEIKILPTGNNMYSIDPTEVPSRVAYKTGSEMGKQLLERELKERGTYPESIAMVLYSGDQMRSYGEDIGEILWLMGLRPKWLGSHSDKVLGVEVIPMEELGRPRIDVVSRISGLLRDTFPSIITLLDEAVKAVLALDENPEENFVKKHYEEDMEVLMKRGIHPDTAHQEAAVRVFGCPPGTYGGGVDILVEAKNWQTDADLATAAITWGAHAYSKELHGKVSRENFQRQLSKVEVTVKNDTTIDFDLFDVDDEFIYHGGLIAAVKQCSGKRPHSYYGNSSDREFVTLHSVQEESARVMRARLLNPIWIEGLKRHGYKGAQDVAYNLDNVFGWDATADIVEDWNYEALAQHFLGEPKNREWLQEANPWALREIAEKLLEAHQRGMWNAEEETLQMVQNVYLESEGLLEEKQDE